jgi:serine/threonine protein kinase
MVEGASRAPLRVVGRYALYGEIAAGGMATVHVGRLLGPVGFSRTVAIKRLHPQFAKDPEFVSMFLDEARVAARIQHPNVVATLDVVALEGELFLVMEYVEGESLGRILRVMRQEKRHIPPKIAAAIVVNVLNGLHAAHEAKSERGDPLGIVHRDVSPQNVLIGIDGVARVLDFGVAKAAGRVQSTREGQVKGKVGYMPPEQVTGDKVDRRVDVYATAVVLWEALTSQRMIDGDNDAVVLHQVLQGKRVPPSDVVPGLPPACDEVVMKGLAKSPKDRYATAHDLAVAIEDSIGIESPRKVAEFIQASAGDAIAKRAARVKEIESISSGNISVHEIISPEAIAAAAARNSDPIGSSPLSGENSSLTRMSSVSVSANLGPQRSRARVIAIAALVSVAGAMLLGILFFARRDTNPQNLAAAAPTASPTGDAPKQSAAPSEAPALSVAPAMPLAIPSESAAASSAPSAAPSAQQPSSATSGLNMPWPKGGPPNVTKKPDCTNPKVLVNGIWKFRPECMN